jgi:signal transduction histidine kinase
MARRFHIKLRHQILLVVFLAAFPALALIAREGRRRERREIEDARARCAQGAEQLAGDIESLAGSCRLMFETLAALPAVKEQDWPRTSRLFAELMADEPRFDTISASAPDGTLLAAGTPAPPGISNADRLWFRDAVRTHAFSAGEYVVSHAAGKPVFGFALPCYDQRGRLTVVLHAGVALSHLQEMAASVPAPAGATLTVTDRNGVVLCGSGPRSRVVGQRDQEAIFDALRGARADAGFLDLRGERPRTVRAYRRLALGDTPYALLRLSVPEPLVIARAVRHARRSALLLVAAAAFAFLLAWFVGSRGLGARLQRLADYARDVAARHGDGAPAVPPPGLEGGEIGELTAVLADMSASLAATIDALRQAHDELEARVAQRTAELRGADADIERSRVELAARAEELARSNSDLEQFAYVASHDLQEPLRMVTSYLQLLERRYKGRLDTDADEFIAFAVDGAQRMKQLIVGLLAYSRVRTRGKPLGPVDMDAVLTAVLDEHRTLIEEAGATVEREPLPTVAGDEGQLRQVMGQLLENACKFRGPRPLRVTIGAARSDDLWRFTVRDNGRGFEARDSERVFGLFTRLHAPGEGAGTGIGLALCRAIVERHGGRTGVETAPGEGASFWFELPVAEEGSAP